MTSKLAFHGLIAAKYLYQVGSLFYKRITCDHNSQYYSTLPLFFVILLIIFLELKFKDNKEEENVKFLSTLLYF